MVFKCQENSFLTEVSVISFRIIVSIIQISSFIIKKKIEKCYAL